MKRTRRKDVASARSVRTGREGSAMVRSVLAASAAALLLASCGNDSGSAAPPPTGPTLPSGTILGKSFTPVEGSVLVLDPGACTFENFQASTSIQASTAGLILGFGSFSGLCSLITTTNWCGAKANGTIVSGFVARGNAVGGTASALGTYPVSAVTPAPDAQGNIVFAHGFIQRWDGTCNVTSGIPATAGTIRIDSITSTRVAGNLDLTFEDGSRFSGPFDVARCGFQLDVCTAMVGGSCMTPTCVQ